MNLRTTLLLLLLAGAGGASYFVFQQLQPGIPESKTLTFLEKNLTPAGLTRIEVAKGKETRLVLERTGDEWSLPGKWPVRSVAIDQYIDALTSLRSRFTPVVLADKKQLAGYGLDDALQITVRLDGQDHKLLLGEEKSADNRFARPTYLVLDDEKEIVRLGPGLVAALDRKQDYFQQRRLFPTEKPAKAGDDKTEQLAAQAVAVKGETSEFALVKKGSDWEIETPVRDRPDPDALKNILAGIPDLWAEKFVNMSPTREQGTLKKKLEEFGLAKPEYTLTVTRPSGATIELLIGAVSESKERFVLKQPPPGMPFPQKPQPQFIKEEFRYAKLKDNDQIFEVKGDKLKDIAPSLAALRDPKVARFKTDEVKRLEIQHGDQTLIFAKDNDKWKFEKPLTTDAENAPISDLLDKLGGLQAKDTDVLDKADPKTVGLEKPKATVKITVEEEIGDKDKKEKKPRDIIFQIGVKEKDKEKLYVHVQGQERVNAVEDSLLKLLERPAVAYRNRKVLDVAAADLSKLEIGRGGETFTFAQEKDKWRLVAPMQSDVDSGKVSRLAGELSRLEAVEFVSDTPKAEDLDKLYGLGKPAVKVQLTFADAKKAPHTLAIGNKRGDKQEFFARLDSGPVIVVRKDLRDDLDREALAYLPLQIVPGAFGKIKQINVHKDDKDYRLTLDKKEWKLSGPFDAPVMEEAADRLADELTDLKAEKFVAFNAKDLKEYGLDKPAMRIQLTSAEEKQAPEELQIGKATDKEPKGRFAKLAKNAAVFILGEKIFPNLEKTALDFLDKKLLVLDSKSIQKIQAAGESGKFTLQHVKDKNEWQVVDSPAPAFSAEDDAVQALLRPWSNLRAEKVAAYGPKIDWAAFGLDKPTLTLTLTAGDKDKTTEHRLALGKEADKGMRYARLDKQDQVVVLDKIDSDALNVSHLSFLNHGVLKFDLDAVNTVIRQMPNGDFELAKRDDAWRFTKPGDRAADDLTVGELLERSFRLRVPRIAAYPAKDLAPFGLHKPAAVVTLKLTDFQGRNVEHVIKVGNAALASGPGSEGKKDNGERYALIDKGESVVVLPSDLSKHLVAPLLHFVDRNLANFASVDRAVVERPGRKFVFSKPDAAWQMIEPVKAAAEDADLEELVRSMRRLRADEILAEKDADLKTYGLEKPEAEWRLQSGDREVLHLMLGGVDKDGRRYGKLGKGDLVFALNSKLSGRLFDEYRSRKPWDALDAVQVEKLIYNGPASFSLKKSGEEWTSPDNAEAKVLAKEVIDTLDALAGLNAARYVADAKADLKLYGLDPPVWTIEAHTSTAKRVLLVGRAEGDTKRFYATTPGSDAVFVLSEADAQRIVRTLPAFVEKKK
ncbi:MAG: DUF4340 domain-containing protein [Gemmataceae bacterium]|nr:DUF4340 domain-containing protein [Gemmataceae bacterium]